jgi:ribonuclease J
VPLDGRGRVAGKIEIAIKGLPVEEDREPFLDDACAAAAEAAKAPGATEEKTREAIRLAVRRVASDWTGKKPIVDVLIVRV